MYLIKQIRSGVDIIKVFESWAGLLDKEDYNEFVIEPNERIKTAIKTSFPKIPIIFSRDSHPENIYSFIKRVKPDVLSLDKEVSAEVLKVAKKNEIILQGNLDPLILINGGKKLEDEVKNYVTIFKNDHIFNLSHGIMPITPLDNVQKTLDTIKSFNETR